MLCRGLAWAEREPRPTPLAAMALANFSCRRSLARLDDVEVLGAAKHKEGCQQDCVIMERPSIQEGGENVPKDLPGVCLAGDGVGGLGSFCCELLLSLSARRVSSFASTPATACERRAPHRLVAMAQEGGRYERSRTEGMLEI